MRALALVDGEHYPEVVVETLAALDYEVSATNLKRVLLRRGAIEPVGQRRAHGPAGGRPAEVFRFRAQRLEVTDPFAVFRPPP